MRSGFFNKMKEEKQKSKNKTMDPKEAQELMRKRMHRVISSNSPNAYLDDPDYMKIIKKIEEAIDEVRETDIFLGIINKKKTKVRFIKGITEDMAECIMEICNRIIALVPDEGMPNNRSEAISDYWQNQDIFRMEMPYEKKL